MSLQFEMTSGNVLEETYQKWVQYKEDCVKMIENDPLPQGMEKSLCKGQYGERWKRKGKGTGKMSSCAILNCIKNHYHLRLLC